MLLGKGDILGNLAATLQTAARTGLLHTPMHADESGNLG